MRGHIRKRGLTYTIYWDTYVNGQRKQKSKGGYKTKKEAEKHLNSLLTSIEKGEYIEPSKQTLEEYLKYWIEHYANSKLAPTTLDRYLGIINNYIIPNLGNVKINKLHTTMIQELITKATKSKENDGFGLSPGSVAKFNQILYKSLSKAVEWQIINKNPAEGIEVPKLNKTKINVLTEEQCRELLSKLEGKVYYLPVLIGLNTGLRRGEILGLKWANVDLDNKKITVSSNLQKADGEVYDTHTKTDSSTRVVTISNKFTAILRKHKAKQSEKRLSIGELHTGEDYVCSSDDGKPLDPNYFSRNFGKQMKKLGYEISLHDTRHTHATHLLKAGVNPKVVSERLGHASIKTTMDLYFHVMPDMQAGVAEKMDDIL